MHSFGLDLDEFLMRSKKSDEFLRHIVDEAKDELGYEANQSLISMRVEVLKNRSVSITFANHSDVNEDEIFRQMTDRLQLLFPDLEREDLERALEEVMAIPIKERPDRLRQILSKIRKDHGLSEYTQDHESITRDDYRLFSFDSISDCIEFTHKSAMTGKIKSDLYRWKNRIYLVVDHERISEKRFNKLTAMAFDFGKVYADPEEEFLGLTAQGELLIDSNAYHILQKL